MKARFVSGLMAASALLLLLLVAGVAVRPAHAQDPPVYLPIVGGKAPRPTATPAASPTAVPTAAPTAVPSVDALPVVNATHLTDPGVLDEAAVFWFGALSPASNSVDVRVGYTDDLLVVYLAIFDRRLWYDETPGPATLSEWDAVTLYIAPDDGGQTNSDRWKLGTQMYFGSAPATARRTQLWTGGQWTDASFPFATKSGWRGVQLNRDVDGRGWAQSFHIPFSSLGIAAPLPGTLFRLGLVVHDRDAPDGSAGPSQIWPAGLEESDPGTWGHLRIGLPGWQAPAASPGGQVVIRRPTQGATSVPDAGVGGSTGNLCGDATGSFWELWPNANLGRRADVNVQNQSDVADWPCFSRYYVTFPLDAVPKGKVLLSATLTLHQYGNSGPADKARPSWVQVLRVDREWAEGTITWNNAPQAAENLGGSWVTPVQSMPPWPGIPWEWDVSRAVAAALAAGQPLRLALYSADSSYHSGKLFVSSDTGDWNSAGRPALTVVWGEP